MDFKNLMLETNDGVATLTVNRPDSLNALNRELLGELHCAISHCDEDRSIQVVILTGAGDKAFVAGADIKEMANMDSRPAQEFALQGQRVMLALEKMGKPVIAAVNGYALGGGLELALGCDFIYASDKAKLGFPEVTLGIMPGFGGTQNLARRVGPAKAKEMILTGKMISAEKAAQWGIVNDVFPGDDLLPKSLEAAAAMVKAGPIGIAYAKDAITHGLDMAKEDGFRYEASLFGVLFATKDQREGMAAFVEKRKAAFIGE